MKKLSIGISTCPNDTFIFCGALNNYINHSFNLIGIMDDVQLLNNCAIKEKLDIVKVSFGVFPLIKDNYKILKSGGALGFNCGPLLLSKKYSSINELKDKKIVIPGQNTTAYMVFKLFFSTLTKNIFEERFDKIMPMIANDEYDAGLVIHEGRFTYNNYNLLKIADLGELWEDKYKQPIPLGFIALHKRNLHLSSKINNMITESLNFAYNNQSIVYEYAKKYAQYLDDNVIKSHVNLYVNKYSFDLTKAEKGIKELLGSTDSIFC